jgi:hypothetical protein
MADNRETAPRPALEPDAGREYGAEPSREAAPSRGAAPSFGHEEAELVADAQEEAVEQGGLPSSRDEAEPGHN